MAYSVRLFCRFNCEEDGREDEWSGFASQDGKLAVRQVERAGVFSSRQEAEKIASLFPLNKWDGVEVVPVQPEPAPEEPKICPNCGAEVRTFACDVCGYA